MFELVLDIKTTYEKDWQERLSKLLKKCSNIRGKVTADFKNLTILAKTSNYSFRGETWLNAAFEGI